jgi:hypothetical protein
MTDALLSWLLTVALAPGAVPSEPSTGPVVEDPAIAEAEAHYRQGEASYEVFDYDDAIEHWKTALSKLPASPATAETRNAIVYNIASAQEKAFAQDHDVVRLHKAKALLERYVSEVIAASSVDDADVAIARARIAELERRIAEAEAEAEPTAPPPSILPTAATSVDDPPRRSKRQRALIGSGAALLGLGVGAVIAGVTTGAVMTRRASSRLPELGELGDEDERADEIQRGNAGETVAIACGAAGGVLAIVGIGLLVAGVKRPAAKRTAWTPALGPRNVGLAFSARF